MTTLNDFQLSIWPDANLVSVTRRFLEEIYEKVFVDDNDTVARIALTVHELLENAVKYSSAGATQLRVSMERGNASNWLTISVTNPVQQQQHLSTLQQTLAAIDAAKSPFDFYQQLMRRNGRCEHGSGLGLARICAEAEMALSCAHDAGRVCVSARTEIQKGSLS
jgi:hypothetical protein